MKIKKPLKTGAKRHFSCKKNYFNSQVVEHPYAPELEPSHHAFASFFFNFLVADAHSFTPPQVVQHSQV